MKKLLAIFGSTFLISSSALTVVACGDSKGVIQLIIPEDPNAFWQDLLDTANKYVSSNDKYKNKYKVKWTSSQQDSNKELTNTKNAVDAGALGVIMGQNNPTQREAAKYVVQNNIPLVAVNIPFANDLKEGEKPNFQVYQDAEEASSKMGKEIFSLLTKNGVVPTENDKLKVFEIWGDPSTPTAQGRHKGFAETKSYDYSWFKGDNTPPINGEGVNGMYLETTANKLVSDNIAEITKKADIIYAHSDSMARGALAALNKSEEGKKWLTPEYDEKTGEITKLGGVIVGYDYDSISVTQIANWKEKPTENIFATIHMSSSDLATKSMAKVIEEIENSNLNKEKNIMEKIDVNVIIPDYFKK
ncbi:sugar ABC transporter substrate-binding protein [Spiroplasma cantharicola]|uniref:Ribose ABC transporter substrate-binding protein n=1 Tax=Spiroplasma cantharicola TaxID=362837 RepID=A0A0M5KEI3_9MOLU|nr:substrate-binding domain-containing protein [Spiroplasma cantharicola]ALD66806.1 ribose ABC transporter substrate-binding protein [Spiroplasma cantharicola]